MAIEPTGPGRLMRGLGIASSGLTAQRSRIETIARNIANAETTATPEGGPYRRQVVRMSEIPFDDALDQARVAGARAPRLPRLAPPVETAAPQTGAPAGGVRVDGAEQDAAEGALIYDPGHPDADADGYVRMPNVDIPQEMIGLMEARRLYEANASVFDAMKAMLSRALRI